MTKRDVLTTLAIVGIAAIALLSRNTISEARERAQEAQDSLAALMPALDSLARSAATADSALAVLRSEREAEHAANEAERQRLADQVVAERHKQAAIRDSVLARVDSATAALLDREREADDLIHDSYERTIETLAADLSGIRVELGAVTAQAARNRAGWDLTLVALDQANARGDAWERAANPSLGERIKGAVPEVGVGVLLALGVVSLVRD